MTRSFLFGGNTSAQSQNKYLVEFRAGKMTMKDRTVSADKRKGLVFVHQTDDSLMHFCWKDRTSGSVEDDLIIFPEDVVFKRVPECTTGRVFVLKFKSSSRRCFYWLQEPKSDRDNEYCTKVNQYLNNPPAATSRSGGASSSASSQGLNSFQAELNNIEDEGLRNFLRNMNHQQLSQLFTSENLSTLLRSGSSGSQASESPRSNAETPQPPTPVTSSVTTTSQGSQPTTPVPTSDSSSTASQAGSSIQLSDLQNILSGLHVPAHEDANKSSAIDLSSALTVEALQPLFNNKELMDRLQNLLPPSFDSSKIEGLDQLRSTVQSPQFQQALGQFSYALQSGQLGPLMQHFGMPPEVVDAANSGDMDAFVRALQRARHGPSSEDKDEDKDEDMSLD